MYVEPAVTKFQPIRLVLETREEVDLLNRIWNRSLTIAAVLEDRLPEAVALKVAVTNPLTALSAAHRSWDERLRALSCVLNASKA